MTNIVPRYLGAILAIGWAAVVPNALRGQDRGELNRLYSQGVNAYFAGRSSDAESNLSRALAIESEDPRLYYFRALSLLRLGRLDEARGDMVVGASVEAQRPQRFAVGKALERVQGSHRLMLERYRQQGRSQAAISPQRLTLRPPQQTDVGDQGVLRQRIVIPLDRLFEPGSPQPLTADELSRRVQPASQTQDMPREAAPEEPSGEDPFRDDPSRPAAEAAEAPVQPAPEPGSPAEPMPEAEEMPEADDDPFSEL